MKAQIASLFLAISMVLGFTMFGNTVASAQQDELCSGANLSLSSVKKGDCDSKGTNSQESKLNNMIKNIVNFISVIVGVVAVIMIIYGGFRYITSGGDSAGVGAAKNTIIYALVGLIIVALAQVIVKFVLSKI